MCVKETPLHKVGTQGYGKILLGIRNTVNVDIFGQYIFSRVSCMVSNARKYDVSENLNHYR